MNLKLTYKPISLSIMKANKSYLSREEKLKAKIKSLIEQWFDLAQTNKKESDQKFEEAKNLLQELKLLRNS
ncbi:Lacal_2735 family protein [Namhaeicola litoreus]|uniref:Lacal_2735 family protein n=1 Tax=Namhaeicola litoreus TaxID=1052145 RepID=A0ABW3XYR7_9FLAO